MQDGAELAGQRRGVGEAGGGGHEVGLVVPGARQRCPSRAHQAHDIVGAAALAGDRLRCRRREVGQRQGGRDDLADKETAEIGVLEAYLPQRLSADAVNAAVTALVAELGAAGPGDMGRVMAAAKARLGGQAEMALVSAAVKQALTARAAS